MLVKVQAFGHHPTLIKTKRDDWQVHCVCGYTTPSYGMGGRESAQQKKDAQHDAYAAWGTHLAFSEHTRETDRLGARSLEQIYRLTFNGRSFWGMLFERGSSVEPFTTVVQTGEVDRRLPV